MTEHKHDEKSKRQRRSALINDLGFVKRVYKRHKDKMLVDFGEKQAEQPKQPKQPKPSITPAEEGCECQQQWTARMARRKKAATDDVNEPCRTCGGVRVRMPMPAGPLARPIMRLVKSGPGVIGYPWIEVISIAHGDPNNFYRTTRYLCRLPGDKAYLYKWFTHSDLYGDGGDLGEYEEE